MAGVIKTERDIIERILLNKFSQIRPFTLADSQTAEKYKDGSFGVSTLAFALYSNGHNLRGKSSNYPYGLMFDDSEAIFSVGYYRREHDPVGTGGYLFFVAPRGKNVISKVQRLTDQILNDGRVPCKGVYLRFLTLNQYLELLGKGFIPTKEHPWHPDAPEEDETLTNSIVTIDNLLKLSSSGAIIDINLLNVAGSKNTRRKAKDSYNRFTNFMARADLDFNLTAYTDQEYRNAKGIIEKHFMLLAKLGKNIGSTPEDHLNIIDPVITSIPTVCAYLGYLNNVPISILVGEKLTEGIFGLYTPFTLRDPNEVLPKLGIGVNSEEATGFTAVSGFVYLKIFAELKNKGFKEVHLGGSEHPDLNKFKRQLGCRNDPSYWAVKLKH